MEYFMLEIKGNVIDYKNEEVKDISIDFFWI